MYPSDKIQSTANLCSCLSRYYGIAKKAIGGPIVWEPKGNGKTHDQFELIDCEEPVSAQLEEAKAVDNVKVGGLLSCAVGVKHSRCRAIREERSSTTSARWCEEDLLVLFSPPGGALWRGR